jgi:hypothetical protein
MSKVWATLFGVEAGVSSLDRLPLWAAWLTLALGFALALWLLSRRIRAYEVVR